MIVWTARKRPVPRNRAMPSAKAPTASGLSREARQRRRRRGWSSCGAVEARSAQPRRARSRQSSGSRWSSTSSTLTAPTQPALRVDDRRGHQVVGGEVAGHLGQRRLRAQRLEVVEHAADQGRRGFAQQPLDVRQAQVAAGRGGRRRAADVHLAGQRRGQLGVAHPGQRLGDRRVGGAGSPARWSSSRRRCPRSTCSSWRTGSASSGSISSSSRLRSTLDSSASRSAASSGSISSRTSAARSSSRRAAG